MKIRNRLIAGLLVLIFCLTLLSGCAVKPEDTNTVNQNPPSTPSNTPQNTNKPAFQVLAVTPKPLVSTQNGIAPAAENAAAGANGFAFRLGAALLAENTGPNFVCSPYSVWLPLAALVNATDDAHRDALLSVLGAQGISVDDLNTAASRMLYDLTLQLWAQNNYAGSYDPLQIANAIFVDNDVTLKQDFAQTFADYYRGSVMNVDFSSPSAVDAVNKWASDNTNGLIDNVVQEFDPATVAAIANAIYFSDSWSAQFDPNQTQAGAFHGVSGDSAANFMLKQGDGLPYYEDGALQAMPLYFQSGGALWILLPKDGDANGLLSSMTSDYFKKIQDGSAAATGKLLLPRFSLDSSLDLKSALTALGVPLFDPQTAPLTGGLIEDASLPLYVSDATQKALIKVDEKGTTAAAVTVMAVTAAGMPLPTTPFSMVCDHPFAFVLTGNTVDGGNQVLFTGVVGQISG
ncbi:MAG: hypothetical protein FWC62_08210 [Firmicutes bacterium]|nr:hypothetical protein [Bacillota bacterium]